MKHRRFKWCGLSGNNNRLDNYSYDAGGNLLNDGYHNYKYDPENRIISVDSGVATYTYDADGMWAGGNLSLASVLILALWFGSEMVA